MLLKRIYKDGRLSHLRVTRAPVVQKFSTKLFEQLVKDGVLSVQAGFLALKTAEDEGDVRYKIVAGPGYYCCHCNRPLGGEAEGKRHVQEEHPDAPSPDPNSPSGYRREHGYTCVRDGEGLDARKAEELVQRQRQAALDRYGEKHRNAASRSAAKQGAGQQAPAEKDGA